MKTLTDLPPVIMGHKPGLVHLLPLSYQDLELEAVAAWYEDPDGDLHKKAIKICIFDMPTRIKSHLRPLGEALSKALMDWRPLVTGNPTDYMPYVTTSNFTFEPTSETAGKLIFNNGYLLFWEHQPPVGGHLSNHARLALQARDDVLFVR